MNVLLNTDHFGLSNQFPMTRGKVRDNYNLLDDRLLIVTTDRISAFDHVLPDGIPFKGRVLNEISLRWLDALQPVLDELSTETIRFEHHLLSADVHDLPAEFQPFADELAGRFMIVNKTDVIPFEGIVRGYISGSLWLALLKARKEQAVGSYVEVNGVRLTRMLHESEKFSQPKFTPSDKAEFGKHDENISRAQLVTIIGEWLTAKGITEISAKVLVDNLERVSVALYSRAAAYAESRGVIIADTKFEFGLKIVNGVVVIVLIDEVLSPDSSRFWPQDKYAVGRSQESFDKQFVRDYLTSCGWDKNSPPPSLPQEIVDGTSKKYRQILELLFDVTL
ncbi:MAG: phosphoribosylaminoimidazolesuccinocarboxamide synthase [Patescibacteria group bacterium]|jgi:phosphoribosylaminoimidazole-succinocarboxamide synthase